MPVQGNVRAYEDVKETAENLQMTRKPGRRGKMTVYIKDIKTGLVEIEKNVSRVITLEDGKIQVVRSESAWLTTSTVYKDSIIAKVEE